MLRSMGFIIHGDAALDDQQTYGPNVTFKMPTKNGTFTNQCIYVYTLYVYNICTNH